MLIDRLLFSDRVPAMLKKALDFQSKRHLLTASNISNLDTPGYKAKDLDFESQLRDAVGSESDLDLVVTQEGHMGSGPAAVKELTPEVFEDPAAAKANGNNVDLDKEMMKLAENQIDYNATSQLMSKRGSTIRAAVTEIAQ
ncbi:MAG: flagellar basal body rod protein FlgB [Nitrospinaceae bacterium]